MGGRLINMFDRSLLEIPMLENNMRSLWLYCGDIPTGLKTGLNPPTADIKLG